MLNFYTSKLLTIFLLISGLSSCTSLFFYPDKKIAQTPRVANIDYEEVRLHATDGTALSAWLIKTSQKRKGVIYFLHGNAENISTHMASVYWLPDHGYDVFLLDYRGYGESAGKPALPEIFDDIDAGFDWLINHYAYPDQENFYFLGQSIGASMGVYWIAHSPVAQQQFKAVVLDAPFSSYPDMIDDVLQRSWLTWIFAKPVSWFFSSRYDADKAAGGIKAKMNILFFHSKDDRVVPFVRGTRVFENLPQTKTEIITQGPHIATFNYSENRKILLNFLQK